LAQCSQTSTVPLATAKPRLLHQIARWRSVIRHSRERVSTALESSGGVLYTTASDALHCTWWCMALMQLPWKPIPWSSLRTVLELIWRPDEVWRSVAIESWWPSIRWPFTWPTTSWLSCCHSQSLPLFYNTTDSWLWTIKRDIQSVTIKQKSSTGKQQCVYSITSLKVIQKKGFEFIYPAWKFCSYFV